MPKDEVLFSTFKMLAVEAALAGNVKAADTYARTTGVLQKLHYRQVEFEQKEEIRRKQEEGKIIAADAQRRSLLLTLSEKNGTTLEETVRKFREYRTYMKKLTNQMVELLG